MRRRLLTLLVCFVVLLPIAASAQTVVLDDTKVIRPVTRRAGLNIGGSNFYDTGQILKNLVGSLNPSFEPLITRQIWTLDRAGSTTSFSLPTVYYGAPIDYWTGGTFTVTESETGGAELGCTGKILANTNSAPNYNDEPVFTVAACAAALKVGDVVVLEVSSPSTAESAWESSSGGLWGSVQNGGRMVSDTTDLCATCGTQALTMDASAAGSSVDANWYYDSAGNQNLFVLMNGTYEISFWAKAAAQNPQVTVNAARFSSNGFNCGSYALTPGTTWSKYTYTCSASEPAGATVPGTAYLHMKVTGGAIYLDNVSFMKVGDSANRTVLRDEVLATLKRFYAQSSGGNSGLFRFWAGQNAETVKNWTSPDYLRRPSAAGNGYGIGPAGAAETAISLEDYLAICAAIGAEPYLEVPVTFSRLEASSLIDFLAGSTSTQYGARRAALGQSLPWTSVFKVIHLSFCNECWNSQSFSGQSLGYRPNTPNNEYYYDYSMVARDRFAGMRGTASYVPGSFDLVMNAQTGVSYSMDAAIKRARPDSIELEDYMYENVSNFSTDAALWTAAMVEPWDSVTDANDPSNFYQSVHEYQGLHTCGAHGTAACNVTIYEWGQSTLFGSIDQQHLDYITAGAGQGVISALQPLLNLQYDGIVNQSYFALTEYNNGFGGGQKTTKLWGNTVDMGGETNHVRPQFLALALVNESLIGPMYACPIQANATFNFAGDSQNGPSVPAGVPALKNVPLVYAFCFENEKKRSVVLINTDLTASHTVDFSGSNTPAGAVTVRQYAPPALDALNEAATGADPLTAKENVVTTTATVTDPGSLTLPPYSVTALDYAVALAGPTFSVAPGYYSATQSVSLADPVGGSTMYYTTDGSVPTMNSPVYTAAIAVAATETIRAIAVNGSLTSTVSTARYTITPAPPAPGFSLAGGSYVTGTTLSLAAAQPGTTIYYTLKGVTPTTASNVYTGPLKLTAAETVSAIAVDGNGLASAVSKQNYKILLLDPKLSLVAPSHVFYNNGEDFQLSSGASTTPTGNVTFRVNGHVLATLGWYYTCNLYEGNALPGDGWVNGNNTVTVAFAGDALYAAKTITVTIPYSGAP